MVERSIRNAARIMKNEAALTVQRMEGSSRGTTCATKTGSASLVRAFTKAEGLPCKTPRGADGQGGAGRFRQALLNVVIAEPPLARTSPSSRASTSQAC